MSFSCVKYSALRRTSLSITNKPEESIDAARSILSCGKYHAETRRCLKANFRARERERKTKQNPAVQQTGEMTETPPVFSSNKALLSENMYC